MKETLVSIKDIYKKTQQYIHFTGLFFPLSATSNSSLSQGLAVTFSENFSAYSATSFVFKFTLHKKNNRSEAGDKFFPKKKKKKKRVFLLAGTDSDIFRGKADKQWTRWNVNAPREINVKCLCMWDCFARKTIPKRSLWKAPALMWTGEYDRYVFYTFLGSLSIVQIVRASMCDKFGLVHTISLRMRWWQTDDEWINTYTLLKVLEGQF